MQTPEEYARDYPEDYAKALAAHLLDLGKLLNAELLDVADYEEDRSLRIERYREVIRAWLDGNQLTFSNSAQD